MALYCNELACVIGLAGPIANGLKAIGGVALNLNFEASDDRLTFFQDQTLLDLKTMFEIIHALIWLQSNQTALIGF